MRTSEKIDILAEALVQAQSEFPSIEKGNINPQFKSKYSNIDAVLAACLPTLTKFGLCLLQPLSNDQNGGVVITTRLLHKSGQWIEDSFTLWPERKTPQGMGSVVTYGRRYAAKAMLGLADDDDDGEAATNHKPHEPIQTPNRITPLVKIPPKPSAKERIPKMLDAFKEHFALEASELEALIHKPMGDLGDEDIKTLEKIFKDLKNKKLDKQDLESIKDVLGEADNEDEAPID